MRTYSIIKYKSCVAVYKKKIIVFIQTIEKIEHFSNPEILIKRWQTKLPYRLNTSVG